MDNDGVIFFSIDDRELSNLKPRGDDIFGEENYLFTLFVQTRYPDKTLAEKMTINRMPPGLIEILEAKSVC